MLILSTSELIISVRCVVSLPLLGLFPPIFVQTVQVHVPDGTWIPCYEGRQNVCLYASLSVSFVYLATNEANSAGSKCSDARTLQRWPGINESLNATHVIPAKTFVWGFTWEIVWEWRTRESSNLTLLQCVELAFPVASFPAPRKRGNGSDVQLRLVTDCFRPETHYRRDWFWFDWNTRCRPGPFPSKHQRNPPSLEADITVLLYGDFKRGHCLDLWRSASRCLVFLGWLQEGGRMTSRRCILQNDKHPNLSNSLPHRKRCHMYL